MSKYGLNLRVKPTQQKKAPPRPPLPTLLGFQDDDDNDVEREISRQASSKKVLRDIEEQHKKALEEDPSVFDYDGVYDEMKEKVAQPLINDRQERKPKYIQALIEKAKVREQEQDIIYERKLAKERAKEDHLYDGKDKFVTGAYKRKLAETAKYKEEERIRQLREEKEDVTKKSDISDFYFNLSNNIAFGAKKNEEKKVEKKIEEKLESESLIPSSSTKQLDSSSSDLPRQQEIPSASSLPPKERFEPVDPKPISGPVLESSGSEVQGPDHHKRNEDAVAAAKARFLARKRAKVE